jgi:hypothetical protein
MEITAGLRITQVDSKKFRGRNLWPHYFNH